MIEAPDLSLAAVAPLLFVFGAACVGVLVEAFAPRDVRHPVQVAVALVGTLGGLVTSLLLAGERQVTAGGALAVDGPRSSCRRPSPGSARCRCCCSPSARWTRPARRSSPPPRCRRAARATAS